MNQKVKSVRYVRTASHSLWAKVRLEEWSICSKHNGNRLKTPSEIKEEYEAMGITCGKP